MGRNAHIRVQNLLLINFFLCEQVMSCWYIQAKQLKCDWTHENILDFKMFKISRYQWILLIEGKNKFKHPNWCEWGPLRIRNWIYLFIYYTASSVDYKTFKFITKKCCEYRVLSPQLAPIWSACLRPWNTTSVRIHRTACIHQRSKDRGAFACCQVTTRCHIWRTTVVQPVSVTPWKLILQWVMQKYPQIFPRSLWWYIFCYSLKH